MSASEAEGSDLITGIIKEINRGYYFNAFNPNLNPAKEAYYGSINLIRSIYDVLNDCNININSHGYTYIKDAVCIIVDLRTLDVCLAKEVYPYIAFKYKLKDISVIEHDIRNSIDAAYKASQNTCRGRSGLMKYYDSRPTNKTFILDTVQKVAERLFEERLKD